MSIPHCRQEGLRSRYWGQWPSSSAKCCAPESSRDSNKRAEMTSGLDAQHCAVSIQMKSRRSASSVDEERVFETWQSASARPSTSSASSVKGTCEMCALQKTNHSLRPEMSSSDPHFLRLGRGFREIGFLEGVKCTACRGDLCKGASMRLEGPRHQPEET